VATSVNPEVQNQAQYRAITWQHDPGSSRSTLSNLPAELARIEELTIAGHCDADHALEAVLRAIASVEQVSGVDIAIAAAGDFVSVASSGVERLVSTGDHFQIYADCIATGRLVRCEDTATDSRARGIPFSSMIVTPLTARGDRVGVLAVYSSEPGVFGQDYIVPFGTAAVICSVLAPQVHESKVQLTSGSQEPLDVTGTVDRAESLVQSDGFQQRKNASPEPGLLTQLTSPPATGPEVTQSVTTGDSHDFHFPQVEKENGDLKLRQNLAREEAIRSVLLNKPGKRFREIPARRSNHGAAGDWFRSPLGITVLLLLLSGFVFGSMQMLRRSAAVASNPPKAAATATRSGTVTKLLGAPRPALGNTVDAQVTRGRLIQDGLPAYPPDALGHAVQGDVTAILLVSERGAVDDVRVTGGDTLLSNSVLSSLSHWRFSPFEVNGRAVAVEVPVMVAFHINVETNSASK
jgi:hypothetical protein